MDALLILAIGMTVVIGGILALRLPAFLALIGGAMLVAYLSGPDHLKSYGTAFRDQRVLRFGDTPEVAAEKADKEVARLAAMPPFKRVLEGFGGSCATIGLLIAMASVIGKCLIDSGAADRIVRTAIGLVGEARAPWAFAGSGFLLGIPVFFDTVFYLLLPLAKSLRARTGKDYLVYVLAIACGGTATHALVPPTPGPLVTADILKVPVGTMILAGAVIAAFTVPIGMLFVFWLGRRFDLPLRDASGLTVHELEEAAHEDDRELPPLWISLVPILLPLVLIAFATAFDVVDRTQAQANVVTVKSQLTATLGAGGYGNLKGIVTTLGDSSIAVSLAALASLWTLQRYRKLSLAEMGKRAEESLESAGTIILITAAGGAFGTVLQYTGLGPRISELVHQYGLPVVPLAFLTTTLIRTAQGSATVAMITAAGVFASVTGGQVSNVWIALAIGCGASPISWMNDSGFWVVGKMSGMTEAETLRSWTPLLAVMGLIGGLFVWLASTLLPHI